MLSEPPVKFAITKEGGALIVSLKMLRKWPIFLLSLATDDSFTVKRWGSLLRTPNCHSILLNLHDFISTI